MSTGKIWKTCSLSRKTGLFKIEDNMVGLVIEVSAVTYKVHSWKLGKTGNVPDREIPTKEGSGVRKRKTTGILPFKQRDPQSAVYHEDAQKLLRLCFRGSGSFLSCQSNLASPVL